MVLIVAAVVAIAAWSAASTIALGATLVALAGTLYGLTITIPRGEAGDVAYDVACWSRSSS